MEVHLFLDSLEKEFNKYSNEAIAASQKKYMRNQFEFHGLTANKRREIQNLLLKSLQINNLKKIVPLLWNKKKGIINTLHKN